MLCCTEHLGPYTSRRRVHIPPYGGVLPRPAACLRETLFLIRSQHKRSQRRVTLGPRRQNPYQLRLSRSHRETLSQLHGLTLERERKAFKWLSVPLGSAILGCSVVLLQILTTVIVACVEHTACALNDDDDDDDDVDVWMSRFDS